MADLIDREALLVESRKYFHNLHQLIREAPAVDAVAVTRCRDCSSSEPCSGVLYCRVWHKKTVPDGFCHEGG